MYNKESTMKSRKIKIFCPSTKAMANHKTKFPGITLISSSFARRKPLHSFNLCLPFKDGTLKHPSLCAWVRNSCHSLRTKYWGPNIYY